MKRVISYGGGLDSWVMLLLAIERGDAIDAVVFPDVADGGLDKIGVDPGEWGGTYRQATSVPRAGERERSEREERGASHSATHRGAA